MDVVAVVGTGDEAVELLHAAVAAGLDVLSVSKAPERMRASLLTRSLTALDELAAFTDDLARLAECSVVFECSEEDAPHTRAQTLERLEARVTPGAVLASTAHDPTELALTLIRPAQFVGIVRTASALSVVPTDETSPGVTGWAEMLCARLSSAFATL